MIDIQSIAVGLVIGAAVGLQFFGGLWWTAQRLVANRHPARLLFTSFMIRISLLGIGLYAASRLGAAAVLAAGVATLAVRQLIIGSVESGTVRVPR